MHRLFAAATALALLAAPAAFAADAKVEKLTFTNKLEGDKKVWLPAEAKLKTGKVELTFTNTLADPHGFTAPGLVEPIVVDGKGTKVVTIDAKAAGTFPFSCQLHPAHVGGKFIVQ